MNNQPYNDWLPVRAFPIDQDLTCLVQFLQERHIDHLITEQRGQQWLAVRDPELIPALNEFLDDYARGRIELQPSRVRGLSSMELDSQALLQQIQATPVVFVLIFFCLIGGFIGSTVIGSQWEHWFSFQDYTRQGYVPLAESYGRGEFWRLFTPSFLHFGLVHLAFNLVMLWWLGQRLELLLGRWSFISLVAFLALASNLSQYLWTEMSNFGGISGVIYGFIGFVVIMQRLRPHPLIAVPSGLLWVMIIWLFICMTGVVDLFIQGGIANANHAGGLAAGLIFGLAAYLLKLRFKV